MELSVVLWNCHGNSGRGFQERRIDSCESTIKSWIEKKEVPAVVLAQEMKGKVRNKWRELSAKSNSSVDCEAACFFQKQPDAYEPDIEFLDNAYLMRIKEKLHFGNGEIAVSRIQCSIMKIRREKFLICSWHGVHIAAHFEKKQLLKKILRFVDAIKNDKNCCVALVGGDFNLESGEAEGSISTFLQSRHGLLHTYDKPCCRPTLIDYAISWPRDRLLLNRTSVIDTEPKQPVGRKSRMFDHALIKYNFTVLLRGKWKGEGTMSCMHSNCGEVKLNDMSDFVSDGPMSGECQGQFFNGSCKGSSELTRTGRYYLRVKCRGIRNGKWFYVKKNKTIRVTGTNNVSWEGSGTVSIRSCKITMKWNGIGAVKWNGKGEATWIGGQLVEWSGNQSVEWAGDQKVNWVGRGKVEFQGGSAQPLTVKGEWTRKLVGSGVVNWNADGGDRNQLEWKGKGVAWKVVGEGIGTAEMVQDTEV